MKTRNVLLYLPGLPYELTAFFPQRTLALVSAALRREGHGAEIWDFGTLGAFAEAGSELQASRQHLPRVARWCTTQAAALRRGLSQVSSQRRETVLARLTRHLPDAVFLLAETRSDFREARALSQRLRELLPQTRQFLVGEYAALFGRVLQKEATWDAVLLTGAEGIAGELARHLNTPAHWPFMQGVLSNTKAEGWHERLLRAETTVPPSYVQDAGDTFDKTQKFALFSLAHPEGSRLRAHYLPARWLAPSQTAWHDFEAEIMALHTQLGARAFWFRGAFGDQDVPRGFPALLESAVSIAYAVELQMEQLSPPFAALLRSSGCLAASVRLDHGSQRLLEDFYGRGFSVSQAERSLRALRDAGIFSVGAFQYPCAEDDYHTREEALRFARRARLASVCVTRPKVLPGSLWRQRPGDFGYILSAAHYGTWCRAAGGEEVTGYRLRAFSHARQLMESELLRGALRELDILQECPAPVALLARVSGSAGQEAAYSEELSRALASFDGERMNAMIRQFNDRAMLPEHSRLLRLQPAFPAAVGN